MIANSYLTLTTLLATCLILSASRLQADLLVSSFTNDRIIRYDDLGVLVGDFVAPGSGGLDGPWGLTLGPDGHLYVSSHFSSEVLRYDGSSGAFVDVFVPGGNGGLDGPIDLVFGPDGNLYVTDGNYDTRVLRFDGNSGAFVDVFAAGGRAGYAYGLTFGPDGHLYVASRDGNGVVRYNGITGAFIDIFASPFRPRGLVFRGSDLYVTSGEDAIKRCDSTTCTDFIVPGSGGLEGLSLHTPFGPDGRLYAMSNKTHEVLRYDGIIGAFVDIFVPSGSGGLLSPQALLFFSPSQRIDVDVKPGSDPNCFNVNGSGVIPVAILGSGEFDVGEIDSLSLAFDGLRVRVRGKRGPLCFPEDSNGDGFMDLVCHFEDDADYWSGGESVGTLTGRLFDGTEIEGEDSICIVP